MQKSLLRGKTTSYHYGVENLAYVLLASAKRIDFCNLFLFHESIAFSVDYFYQWLVRYNVDRAVMEEVAAAVKSQEIQNMLDVSIVQMFLSRSIHQQRNDGSPSTVDVTNFFGYNCDDSDEL